MRRKTELLKAIIAFAEWQARALQGCQGPYGDKGDLVLAQIAELTGRELEGRHLPKEDE